MQLLKWLMRIATVITVAVVLRGWFTVDPDVSEEAVTASSQLPLWADEMLLSGEDLRFSYDFGFAHVLIERASPEGLSFVLRNTSGMRLYHSNNFILSKCDKGEWESIDFADFIIFPMRGPNENSRIQAIFINTNDDWYIDINETVRLNAAWPFRQRNSAPFRKVPGRYSLKMDFFTVSDGAENKLSLDLKFDVFEHDLEGFDLSERVMTLEGWERHLKWRQNAVDFAIAADNTGEVIVNTGDVLVSRTAVAFNLENRSVAYYRCSAYFELMKYVDGVWLSVPYESDDYLDIEWFEWFTNRQGFGVPAPLPPGAAEQRVISFNSGTNFAWPFAALENGQYKLIARYFREPVHYSLDASGVRDLEFMPRLSRSSSECILIPFEIAESTPHNLDVEELSAARW